MANVFLIIPTLAGNGTGAPVDVSGMGENKTITVGASGGMFEPIITIEVSLDAGGTNWAPLWSFQGKTEKTFDVACHWMRATTSSFNGGGAPVVGVGGSNAAPTFATLVATAGSGSGAGVDTSAMAPFKTIQVATAFRGVVNIEASEDGGVTFSTVMSFIGPGIQSEMFTADHMRVTRAGVPVVGAGLPVITVAGAAAGSAPIDGNPQRFAYVATGAEGATFTVNLPAARLTTNYMAQATNGGVPGMLVFDTPRAQYTLATIQVRCSAPPVAGDVIMINVVDLT